MDRFLIRTYQPRGAKRSPYVVAEEIAVMFPVIYRKSGRQSTIGGIPINRQESTGRRDRKRLDIVVRKGTTARGIESSRSRDRAQAAATAAGVKQVIRQLRPQEAAMIDEADKEIAELEEQLAFARDNRAEIVRNAWGKAHVVRLADMRERAENHEAELQRQKEAGS